MSDNKKIDEIERLLKELKAQQEETAVTMEMDGQRQPSKWRVGKIIFSLWKRPFILIALFIIVLVAVLPFATMYVLKSGSTFTEQKGVFLERVQQLNELATAEAYTKVIVERQDNTIFGQSIGLDLPGTKRQLLVIIPGSVKAGVELSEILDEDVVVNEEKKTVKLSLPPAKFLGGPEIYFDQVEVFSYEGLFREKANIEEAYELAEDAKKQIVLETTEQGVLQMAEENAEKTLREMFSFAGYEVTIDFKE